jgi:hypothetical protein
VCWLSSSALESVVLARPSRAQRTVIPEVFPLPNSNMVRDRARVSAEMSQMNQVWGYTPVIPE